MPVVRSAPSSGQIGWDPGAGTIDAGAFEGVDAVVHLAGAGIGDAAVDRRAQAVDPRVADEDRPALLARTLAELDHAAEGAAVRLGHRLSTATAATRSSPSSRRPGSGFLSEVCVAWEAAAQPAVDAGIRTAFLRTGIVQTADGGALAKTLTPVQARASAVASGQGTQWWSWISIDDEVRAILHLLDVRRTRSR